MTINEIDAIKLVINLAVEKQPYFTEVIRDLLAERSRLLGICQSALDAIEAEDTGFAVELLREAVQL